MLVVVCWQELTTYAIGDQKWWELFSKMDILLTNYDTDQWMAIWGRALAAKHKLIESDFG